MIDRKMRHWRAVVIEKFINLEWEINTIISHHYFRKLNFKFVVDILYDELCSFGLRRRILEKIIPNIDNKQIENLNRLNTIRNYFAHTGKQIFTVTRGPQGKLIVRTRVPDPRKPSEEINFASLYEEFQKKEPMVAKYLSDISQRIREKPKGKGGAP